MSTKWILGTVLALLALPVYADDPNDIPEHCKTDIAYWHIETELPRIFNLGKSAATIDKIEFLADVPRVTYYPAVGKAAALRMLQCPIKVTWSNGHEDFGYYMEWEDHHQQIRVAFTDKPMQPPSRD